MDTVTLIVPGIRRAATAERIQRALESVKGVRRAAVDVRSRWVTISFDPDQVGVWELVTRIESEGFPVGGLMPTIASDRPPALRGNRS